MKIGFLLLGLTPKCADVHVLDDVQKLSLQWTEKTVFLPSKFLLLFLSQWSNTCTVQIFRTTFYDFPINRELKVYQVSSIVQNLVSKSEPHMFHRKIFFKIIEE